jgi:hypothetical protein
MERKEPKLPAVRSIAWLGLRYNTAHPPRNDGTLLRNAGNT